MECVRANIVAENLETSNWGTESLRRRELENDFLEKYCTPGGEKSPRRGKKVMYGKETSRRR